MPAMSNVGREWPSESTRLTDEWTGAAIWRMTSHPSINHNLYFLTSSFMPDEDAVVFASFRDGRANYYRAGFPDGLIVQLTDADDVNSYSAVISQDGQTLYYTRGPSIVALSLDSLTEAVLADVPDGKLGEVGLSADERWIVSAVRLEGEFGIVVAATDGSGGRVVHRQPRTIIHPQFHPTDTSLIEYAADPAPRMFLIRRDGTQNRCLYEHGDDEFVVHETWLGDTGDLVFTVWPYALKRMSLPSGVIRTIAELNAWHLCPSRNGRFVLCDTNHPDVGILLVNVASGARRVICHPGSSNGGSQWAKDRYALKADFDAAARRAGSGIEQELSWMEMRTDTVYGPQWTHPHPAFSRSERYAAFTSDRTGHPQVYVVELDTEWFAAD